MGFLLARALEGQDADPKTFLDTAPAAELFFSRGRVCTEACAEYLEGHGGGVETLAALLRAEPPGPTEACWDWRARPLPITQTLAARGASYNGYPVSAGSRRTFRFRFCPLFP